LRRDSGFTLVEVLLGLLIFSLIAAGLYGTFRGGLSVNRRVQEVNTGYQEIRWIFDQMASDLENAINYDFSGSYPDLKSFEGGAEQIRLVVDGKNGLMVVTYSLKEPSATSVITTIVNRKASKMKSMVLTHEEAARTRLLIRTEEPLVSFLGKHEPQDQEVLSFLVRNNGLKFSYAAKSPESSSEVPWENSWSKDTLPALVKMDLLLANFDSSQGDLSFSREIWVPMGS
jgi:prepilin-type N-terminal cleavage/methylation domain-containing protein